MHSSATTGRRAGLAILGLLSLADSSMLLLTDGNTPPYSVAALATGGQESAHEARRATTALVIGRDNV